MEPKKQRYHHGDLRAALLKAAEQELKARGIEQFSLRGVARAAGVSHAAPAHHFDDVTGLLTALAVVGWHRFVEAQRRQQAKAEAEPLAQLVAAAKGYAAFAKANPELFVLMFASQKADRCDPAFKTAGDAAFDHLLGLVNTVAGRDADAHPDTMIDALATWSLIHGIASLLNNGFLLVLGGGRAERDAAIAAMITRYWQAQPAV